MLGMRARFEGCFSFEKVAHWLTQRQPREAWALVLVPFLVITGFDLSPYGEPVNARSLYIIPLALACWMLGPRHGFMVMFMVVVTLFVKAPLSYGTPGFLSLIGNGIIRTVAYTILTIIVLSFRRVYDQALAMANQDRMTGVLNGTAFNKEAAAELAMARSRGDTLLMAYMDLDGFKTVNDLYGHEAGDALLTMFARRTDEEMRPQDRFGRLGGDEFAMVLRAKSVEQARRLADKLHARMSAALADDGYGVTVSMGALIVPPDDDRGHAELMREADELMYAAKHAGKNKVRTAIASMERRAEDPTRAPFTMPASAVRG